MTRDIRAKALQRIAALSAESSTTSFDKSDLDKLCRACHSARGREYNHGGYSTKQAGSLGRIPMVRSHCPRNNFLCPQTIVANAKAFSPFANSRSSWLYAKPPQASNPVRVRKNFRTV